MSMQTLLECLDHSMHTFHVYSRASIGLLASSLWAMGTYIHGSHTHRSSCFLSFSTALVERHDVCDKSGIAGEDV